MSGTNFKIFKSTSNDASKTPNTQLKFKLADKNSFRTKLESIQTKFLWGQKFVIAPKFIAASISPSPESSDNDEDDQIDDSDSADDDEEDEYFDKETLKRLRRLMKRETQCEKDHYEKRNPSFNYLSPVSSIFSEPFEEEKNKN